MANSPFVAQLISLRCVTAQENDGDEIYLTLDDRIIWSAGAYRLCERLDDDSQADEVDFAHGRLHTRRGWIAMPSFTPGEFRFEIAGAAARLQVWERDLLVSDDLIGDAPLAREDARHGQIQLAFTGEGAHYLLKYEVTA